MPFWAFFYALSLSKASFWARADNFNNTLVEIQSTTGGLILEGGLHHNTNFI